MCNISGSSDLVSNGNGDQVKIKNCDQLLASKRNIRSHYSIQSYPRGFCLIFDRGQQNNDFSTDLNSANVIKRLSRVFELLHFISHIFLQETDIKSTIDEYSKKEELNDHDCIIVIVIKDGGLIGSYSGFINDVVEKLNNKNCPALIDKPKLFFFGCCRGIQENIDANFKNRDDLNINVMESLVNLDGGPSLPIATDIIICYSISESCVPSTNKLACNWLAEALAETLIECSHESDLLQILTLISNKSNERQLETNVKQYYEICLHGVSKIFYFNPGYIFQK